MIIWVTNPYLMRWKALHELPQAKALAHRNTNATNDLNPEAQRGEMTCLEIPVVPLQSLDFN